MKSSPEGFSINDYLEDGPEVIPYSFDSLLNFRRDAIGLTADTESAFYKSVFIRKFVESYVFYGTLI